jgi:2-polyprenyl-3-methyl-5-hydroxy-6-metoxy-1,4-benzoquinol methylase
MDNAVSFFKENGYSVVKCQNCGLVYVNPQPIDCLHGTTKTEKNEYSNYIRDYITFQNGHRLHSKKILSRLEKIQTDKGKLLEIGCAAGFLLDTARKMGWQVEGIEPEDSIARYAIKKFNLNVRISSIEFEKFPENHFDAVIALNVLSHLKDPKKIVKKINYILKKNGIFVFKTGNKGAMRTKKKGELFGESWLTPEHLYHFSEKPLTLLLKHTGFKIEAFFKEHIVEHMLSEEILLLNRSTSLKWFLKKELLKHNKVRSMIKFLLKFFSTEVLNSDVCSLIYIVRKV